jgi:hypothetical protein
LRPNNSTYNAEPLLASCIGVTVNETAGAEVRTKNLRV